MKAFEFNTNEGLILIKSAHSIEDTIIYFNRDNPDSPVISWTEIDITDVEEQDFDDIYPL